MVLGYVNAPPPPYQPPKITIEPTTPLFQVRIECRLYMEKLQAPPTVYRFDTSQSSRPLICFPKTIVDFFLPKKKKGNFWGFYF
jgi:hypothetical protein